MNRRAMTPPAEGKFFMFGPESESSRGFRGARIENMEELLTAPRLILRPDAGGFPPLGAVPRVVIDPSEGPVPRDLEGGFSGYWLVSEQLQLVMSAVDPEAFAFLECEVRHADGSSGARRFLCDVVREVDAVDEAASTLKIKLDDDYVRGKFYSLGGGASLVFKRDRLADAHVFLTPFNPSAFCDETFRRAIQAAGIAKGALTSGISFVDAADI